MIGPRSLADTCLKVVIDNVNLIQSLSNLAPKHIQSILKSVKTAAHLHTLELNSGDIYDETAVHWQRIIMKDFPILHAQHNYAPKNRKSWHLVHERYNKLQEEQIAAATEKMMQDFAARKEQKHSRASTIISGSKYNRLLPSRAKSGFGAPREKQTFFRKARAEVRKEASRFKIRTPTGKLTVPPGQIKKAPEAMLNDMRIASRPSLVPPDEKPAPMKSQNDLDDREAKEARLRRIKNQTTSPVAATQHLLSFSDDEDIDIIGHSAQSKSMDDDVFGDLQPKKMASSTSTSKPAKTASVSAPTTKQPAKRRMSIEETARDPPLKRHRGVEKTTPSASTPTTTKAPSFKPAAAPNPLMKPRRPKVLSAAPGANSVIRKFKPPIRPTTPPNRSRPNNNKPSVNPMNDPEDPPRSQIPRTPEATRRRHPHDPDAVDSGDEAGHETEAAQRRLRHMDGSLTPKKFEGMHGIRLHNRGIQICRPNVWPKKMGR